MNLNSILVLCAPLVVTFNSRHYRSSNLSYINFQVEYQIVDLASFSDIKKFADSYKESHSKLDILVNNAGVVKPPFSETKQGIEATTGINYLLTIYL